MRHDRPPHRSLRRVPLALLLIALITVFLPPVNADAQATGAVEISEIFYNPDGQAEGHEFIELHNTSASPVDISGWQLVTGVVYTFPAGSTIDANSYIVLAQVAADFNTVFGFVPTGEFIGSLSNGGETLTLQDSLGVTVDLVSYDDIAPWPLSADGADDSLVSIDSSLPADDAARWIAGTPTPQVANDPVLAVQFSVERGWYGSGQTVTLTPTVPGAQIFYNTNGSGAVTTQYTGPISVSANNDIRVIQAQASFNGQAGALTTHTYVFKPDTGAPVIATWPNGLAVDPTEDELTRSFEFIPPPSTGLAPAWANAGVKASAGGVAAGESDKFFFRGFYGNGTLSGDLFGDNYYGVEPTTSIDQLFLRNNQGDSTHLRQIFAHDALLETGQLSPHGRFVQYYKSGVDEGVRHMQERPEGGFMESYTGIAKSQWLAWSTNEVTPGSGELNGLGNETMGAPFSSWADATSSIDPDSLIDYLLVQWQAKVSDYRNLKNFRTAGPVIAGNGSPATETLPEFQNEANNYRYHFFNWDLDLGYNNNQYDRGGPTGWGWAGYTSPDYLAHELDGFIEFRLLASDRITCAHFDGGPLTQQAFSTRLDARLAELIAAGGANEQSFVNSLKPWIGQRNAWLIDEYRSDGANRTVYGRFRPDRAPWKPPSNFNGPLLQQDDPLTYTTTNGVLSITNPNGGQVYYQLDGGDPRLPNGALSPSAIAYNGPVSLPAGRIELIARSFDANDGDTFQAWSPACNEPAKIDIAVSGNPGASPGEGLMITEIQFNPQPETVLGFEAEFIEVHNTTDAPINTSGFSFSDGIEYTFPAGSVIGPDERIVLVPVGASAAHVVEYALAGATTPAGEYDGRLGDGGEAVTLIDAVGAEIDTITYDDVSPWPTTADGQGPSLSLTDPALDNSLPSSWGPSRSTGTPGSANDTGPNGDVNCDGRLSVADSLFIAQLSVGNRSDSGRCPIANPATQAYAAGGDFNGNGRVSVGDALLIAQCAVGNINEFCP